MNANTRLDAGSATKCRKPRMVMQLGPPWSISVVDADRTPTMSAFSPNFPVTCS